MGCCLGVIIALLVPRVTMILMWIFTDWFSRSFKSYIVPVMGFLFMPYTTLAYMVTMLNNNYTVNGGWIALMLAAVVFDLSNWGAGGRYRKAWRS